MPFQEGKLPNTYKIHGRVWVDRDGFKECCPTIDFKPVPSLARNNGVPDHSELEGFSPPPTEGWGSRGL